MIFTKTWRAAKLTCATFAASNRGGRTQVCKGQGNTAGLKMTGILFRTQPEPGASAQVTAVVAIILTKLNLIIFILACDN